MNSLFQSQALYLFSVICPKSVAKYIGGSALMLKAHLFFT